MPNPEYLLKAIILILLSRITRSINNTSEEYFPKLEISAIKTNKDIGEQGKIYNITSNTDYIFKYKTTTENSSILIPLQSLSKQFSLINSLKLEIKSEIVEEIGEHIYNNISGEKRKDINCSIVGDASTYRSQGNIYSGDNIGRINSLTIFGDNLVFMSGQGGGISLLHGDYNSTSDYPSFTSSPKPLQFAIPSHAHYSKLTYNYISSCNNSTYILAGIINKENSVKVYLFEFTEIISGVEGESRNEYSITDLLGEKVLHGYKAEGVQCKGGVLAIECRKIDTHSSIELILLNINKSNNLEVLSTINTKEVSKIRNITATLLVNSSHLYIYSNERGLILFKVESSSCIYLWEAVSYNNSLLYIREMEGNEGVLVTLGWAGGTRAIIIEWNSISGGAPIPYKQYEVDGVISGRVKVDQSYIYILVNTLTDSYIFSLPHSTPIQIMQTSASYFIHPHHDMLRYIQDIHNIHKNSPSPLITLSEYYIYTYTPDLLLKNKYIKCMLGSESQQSIFRIDIQSIQSHCQLKTHSDTYLDYCLISAHFWIDLAYNLPEPSLLLRDILFFIILLFIALLYLIYLFVCTKRKQEERVPVSVLSSSI